jgi:hypothetical protein
MKRFWARVWPYKLFMLTCRQDFNRPFLNCLVGCQVLLRFLLRRHCGFWHCTFFFLVARCCCSKIAEAEAVVSVNEKKLLEMHMYMHVQLMH